MRRDLIDIIQLNTYVDLSVSGATQAEISELLATCEMKLDLEYLNFLSVLNGIKIDKLTFYGINTQRRNDISDLWHVNEFYRKDSTLVRDYFLIGEGFEEWYAWHPVEKKYFSVELQEDGGVERYKAFDNFDSFLDWMVKVHCTRRDDKKPIVQGKVLLYMAERMSAFIESRGFIKNDDDAILRSAYGFVREIPGAREMIRFDLQVNKERNRLFVNVIAWKRYSLIENFFDHEDVKKLGGANRHTILLREGYKDWENIHEREANNNYEELTTQFISFINTNVLPVMSLYDDVRVLNANVNESADSFGNIQSGNLLWYYKMVIAKLAGDHIYDQIFKSTKDRFDHAVQKEPDNEYYRASWKAVHNLNDRLKNVEPLKDGMLI